MHSRDLRNGLTLIISLAFYLARDRSMDKELNLLLSIVGVQQSDYTQYTASFYPLP
jgi:hypothetical protein